MTSLKRGRTNLHQNVWTVDKKQKLERKLLQYLLLLRWFSLKKHNRFSSEKLEDIKNELLNTLQNLDLSSIIAIYQQCSITQWSILEYWKLRPRYGMVLPLLPTVWYGIAIIARGQVLPLLPTGPLGPVGNNEAMLAHGQ